MKDVDFFTPGARLALELECLLMDTRNDAAQSRWWDSAHEALEQWRQAVRAMEASIDAVQPEASTTLHTAALQAEIEGLRAEVDALRLNAASVQPELVAVALAACDAVDDLIEKWYATRESGCLPIQVVRARGASKLLRAIALEGTK